MAFYAANFAYDGIIGSEYGLRISSSDGEDTSDGATVTIQTQEMYRRPKQILVGVQQTPVLEIPITINTRYELSATEDSVISNWLFGSLNYKKLQILQPDMQYMYFNCILKDKQTIRVGNIIRGYTATITCDSPFAWEYPRTVTKSYPGSYIAYDDFIINNTSDNADYTYPTLTITANVFGGDITITNLSDVSGSSTRTFKITGMPANEVITVDNDLQIISASPSGTNFLPYLDGYKWLRYVKGENHLLVEGSVASLEFEHSFARKVS